MYKLTITYTDGKMTKTDTHFFQTKKEAEIQDLIARIIIEQSGYWIVEKTMNVEES